MADEDVLLLVDGYNMIGAWPEMTELASQDFEEARHLLIEWLADFQGYTGWKVIVVFDAHLVAGPQVKMTRRRLEIVYTKEKETADECIERQVVQLARPGRRIYVATSDHVEQRVTFGQGALRISARELLTRIRESRSRVEEHIRETALNRRNPFDGRMDEETKKVFEQWRRGKNR